MLTGAALYAPLYDAGGELVDFRFVRLNPAGQRLLGLLAQPAHILREYYPTSVPTGIVDQYRTAFLRGQATTYDVPYAGDGLHTYFRLVAQRSGELLVVSFTDMAGPPSRAELEGVFAQALVGLVLLQGPEYRIDLANSMIGQIWGCPVAQVLGRPVFEAMPDLQQQGFEDILADVYHRGIPYSLWELPITIARTRTGLPAEGFYNVIYQPHRNRHGDFVAIVCLVIEVTDQVRARQQVQTLNDALRTANDEYVPRFQVTIIQLTDISRLQLARTGPAEPVRLARVVEDVCLDLTPVMRAAGIQPTAEVVPTLLVSFSPANLLSNAIKYFAPNRLPQVWVRAAQTPQGVVLEV